MNKTTLYWKQDKQYFFIQIVGFLFFSILLVLSLIFYKERTLFADSAGLAFELAQTKSFVVPLNRWGHIFSQIIPLLALKTGCSLATFLKIYSVNFIFLHYLGFIIISTIFKNKRIAIIYLLALCLTCRNTFYFPSSIFSESLSLVIILYAMTEYLCAPEKQKKTLVLISALGLIFCLYFFHQLLILAILFVILVSVFKNKMVKNKYLTSLFVFTLLWFGLKVVLLPHNSYEANQLLNLNVFIDQLPNFFYLPSYNYFIEQLQTELIVPFLIGLVSLIALLLKKRVDLFLLFTGYVIGYFVLIIITYYYGQAPNMYQQHYTFFGFMIAILLDTAKEEISIPKPVFSFLMVSLLLFSTQRIYAAHKLPSKRLNYISALAKKGKLLKNKKYIIHQNDFPWSYAWVSWGFPIETLLVSSIKNKNNTVTYYMAKNDETIDLAPNNGRLLGPSWLSSVMNVNVLDTNFFNLPVSTKYLLIER